MTTKYLKSQERYALTRTIENYRLMGWIVLRLRSVDPAGYPDLLCIRKGVVKFIEVKRADGLGKLSMLQEKRIAELKLHYIKTELI